MTLKALEERLEKDMELRKDLEKDYIESLRQTGAETDPVELAKTED